MVDLSKTDRPRVQKAVETIAWPKFKASFAKMGTTRNGWNRPSTIGKYGDDIPHGWLASEPCELLLVSHRGRLDQLPGHSEREECSRRSSLATAW
jgi:hypothetical protein